MKGFEDLRGSELALITSWITCDFFASAALKPGFWKLSKGPIAPQIDAG